jgi:radical SAM superfamily enzyme YgiQ (UPF0313 family)
VALPRTVLVSSPAWADFPIVPHSLLELAASLRARGLPVEIVDVKAPPHAELDEALLARTTDRIVAEVVRREPDWIGLPCYTTDFWHVRELARRLRERLPAARIVAGGPHPTLRPDELLDAGSPFDVVAIGEADETLPELVASDGAGRPLEDVRGIAFRRGDELVRTAPRPVVEDLGTLPRPAYDLVDMEWYLRPNRHVLRTLVVSGVQVYTSRGCPYRCTFCAARAIQESQGLPTLRHRPVAQVVGTLRWLRETWGLDTFYLADDTFAVPRERALEFCLAYRASGLELPWGAQTRADVLDEELARELRDAGCVQLDLGVESGSDAALRRMAKGITVAQTRRAVALCRSHGLRVFANVMFNTPGETAEDVRLTRELMRELRADHYGVLLTVPVPGTRIFADRFPDGLAREEYRLFACSEPYTRIVDPRFRLAAHDLDLDRLYVAVSVRHYLGNNLRFLSLRGWYLRLLARSRRRGAYAATWVSSFLRLTLRSVKKLVRLTLRGAG